MKKKTVSKPYIIIDFETRNPVKDILKDRGAYNYARHKQTEVLLFAYRFSDWGPGRVEVWEPKGPETPAGKVNPFPKDLKNFRGVIVAHNYVFEYCIIQNHII